MPLSAIVSALLDQFHAAKPVRAWSLIVTLYGDAIVPRGGSLWLGSLTEIMARFRIDAGHVRTAMSRLTSDGWLERERIGRNSYYRLSKRGEGSFVAATRRIYFAEPHSFDGRLRLALLGPGVDDRTAIRPTLEKAGFAPLSPMAYVAVADPSTDVSGLDGVYLLTTDAADAAHGIVAAAWKLEPIAAAYRTFIDRFAPVEAGLLSSQGRFVDDADALIARILLIHEFRRIVLRDPDLPAALLPAQWPGAPARALASNIYKRLVPAAERYLDASAQNDSGPIPRPESGFENRFVSP